MTRTIFNLKERS